MSSSTLHRVGRLAPYPRAAEMFVALVLLSEVALFAMVTVRFRFQLVDWRVESRDIQHSLRELEAQHLMLRRDVAALSKGSRLAEFAEERFELRAAEPDQLSEIEVSRSRAEAWNRVLSRSQLAGESRRAAKLDPLSWEVMLDRISTGQQMFEALGQELERRGERLREGSSPEPLASKDSPESEVNPEPIPNIDSPSSSLAAMRSSRP